MQPEVQNRKSKIIPLTLEFFGQLSKLEEGFHIKVLDPIKINVLIQKYAQLVEYYDFHKDPIKNYFLDKIQFVLSRPDTIKSMFSQNSIMEVQEESNEDVQSQVSKFMTVSRAPSIAEQMERKHVIKGLSEIETTQKQRGQQLNLTLQIEKHKKEHEPSLNKLMTAYQTEQEQMDQYIQTEMKNQTDVVQQKLERRKQKLTTQTTSNQIFRIETSEDEISDKNQSQE